MIIFFSSLGPRVSSTCLYKTLCSFDAHKKYNNNNNNIIRPIRHVNNYVRLDISPHRSTRCTIQPFATNDDRFFQHFQVQNTRLVSRTRAKSVRVKFKKATSTWRNRVADHCYAFRFGITVLC